jgi:hypothetical protein
MQMMPRHSDVILLMQVKLSVQIRIMASILIPINISSWGSGYGEGRRDLLGRLKPRSFCESCDSAIRGVIIMQSNEGKLARTDGMIAELLSKVKIPKVCKVRQQFDNVRILAIEEEVRKELQRPGTLDRISSGESIAIAVGSRGVANIARVIKTIANEVKRAGGNPFIVPAMGSHGGATAEGQSEVLASFGITEETMGCPIRATMETVQIGQSDTGLPVYMDKYAYEADGIIVVNRIKPHTGFRGLYESGLLKMIVIGLGKQKGAELCHSQGMQLIGQNIVLIAKVVLQGSKILFGVATVENAYDQTRRIKAIPTTRILMEEPELLIEAKKNMGSILIEEIDVLVIDEIGKNISGDGMDPNITGNFATPYATGGIKQQRIVVLDLTEETHGNFNGLGMADFSVQRAFDKCDFEKTYPNTLTSGCTALQKIPLILANDRLAIKAAIQTCDNSGRQNPRIIRIKNTLELGEINISENLLENIRRNPRIEILEEPQEMRFDINGNLF